MRICRVVAAATVLAARAAWADSPMPEMYGVTEDPPGTVRIRLLNYEGRKCPDEGLLRQDVNTRAIVRIDTCDGDDFLDQCVLAGTYRYGLAKPYTCPSAGAYWYAERPIAGAASPCTRSIPDPVAASSVPWTGDESAICTYHRGGEGGGCGAAPVAVLGTNLALLLVGLAGWRWRPGSRKRA